ncbi:MAG TPA: hypothetical protein VMV93_06290 [Chloroflexota bacterium]|nr:hypothetical protein [Chloroflexota bacterium]
MAKPADITDQAFRDALIQAEQALDEGNYGASVRSSVAAYTRLIDLRPDTIVLPFDPAHPRPGVGPAPRIGGPAPWPAFMGVRLDVPEEGNPSLVIERERFTMTEAATFFEFTVDAVLRAQRTAPTTG